MLKNAINMSKKLFFRNNSYRRKIGVEGKKVAWLIHVHGI